jgi:hypothetical protein
MPVWGWIVIAVVLVAAAAAAWWAWNARRSLQLKERFGREYDRTVADTGDRRQAESDLEARRKRRAELDIRQLDPAARQRYVAAWRAAQTRFVDDPGAAIAEADSLVIEVMRERGYPMDDFEQRAADVSVDHPQVVDNYRRAHVISERNTHGAASTEDLRQGMVHYRALFDELLEGSEPTAREAR